MNSAAGNNFAPTSELTDDINTRAAARMVRQYFDRNPVRVIPGTVTVSNNGESSNWTVQVDYQRVILGGIQRISATISKIQNAQAKARRPSSFVVCLSNRAACFECPSLEEALTTLPGAKK